MYGFHADSSRPLLLRGFVPQTHRHLARQDLVQKVHLLPGFQGHVPGSRLGMDPEGQPFILDDEGGPLPVDPFLDLVETASYAR